MQSLHISISAEPVFHIGNFTITNSILVTWGVTAALIVFAILFSRSLKLKGKLTRLQLVMELVIEGLYNMVASITGKTKARVFFPLIATFFVFIIVSNWSGLIPGFGAIGFREMFEGTERFVPYLRAPTADLNTTLALGIFSILAVQVIGFKYQGLGYVKKFINLSNPINFFIGIIELISEVAKIISFAFRLFGNIVAGEILLLVMAFIMPILGPTPFIGLELFVGFIQALVFTMLTAVFVNMATLSHGHAEE